MAVTALAWNLEDFGVRYGSDATAGTCETLRCALVAGVVIDAGAQVLVIQEMRQQGVTWLPVLQAMLNGFGGVADWHYDWLPGSVPTAVGGFPPATIANLGFTVTGNQEGYAVLYRQGRVAAQAGACSAGQDTGLVGAGGGVGNNFIDLVTTGYPLVYNNAQPVITFNNAGAVNTLLGFPQSTCPDVGVGHMTRSGGTPANTTVALNTEVRRPCHVNIVDTAAMPALTVPLVVYHAPVGQNASNSPLYGALIGFASQALQGAGDKAYAGDLNVVSATQQAVLRNRSHTQLNYVSQTFGGMAYQNTSVHAELSALVWRNGAGVLTQPRDYGFSLGNTVVDVPPVFTWMTTGGTQSNNILAIAAVQAAITASVLPRRAAHFPANAAAVQTAFFGGGAYPVGTDAATGAALLFNLLLSDHFPVRISHP